MTPTVRRVMVVYGTRPEAIKVAPVIRGLQEHPLLDPLVVVTGQHRAMLDQVNELFGIVPSHDLDIIAERQTLEDITSRTLIGLRPLLESDPPDCVLVQGDTTTCFAAALAASYHKVPVVHLEAGLRTGNRFNPFPEEMSRRLVGQLASLHLAPTTTSRDNLRREGIDPATVTVTGNTVIDALLSVVSDSTADLPHPVQEHPGKVVLVTAHRRESWGEPMRASARAIATLAGSFPDVLFVLPAHLNPVVREVLLPVLTGLPNVVVTDPLPYAAFAHLMDRSDIVLTDSGGVQEEAPSLGKPVLVMRDTTERPEAVTAGTVRLVGTDEQRIVAEVSSLLTDRTAYAAMANAVNPYGDGRAAPRAVAAIAALLGRGERAEEFGG